MWPIHSVSLRAGQDNICNCCISITSLTLAVAIYLAYDSKYMKFIKKSAVHSLKCGPKFVQLCRKANNWLYVC